MNGSVLFTIYERPRDYPKHYVIRRWEADVFGARPTQWMRLANTHAYLANQSAGKGQFADAKDHRATRRTFIARAWRGVPQEPETFRDWCFTNSELFWNERDELTQGDKEFAMTMTGKLVGVFDKDAFAHDLHARFYFVTGQRSLAVDEALKAVELDPSVPEYKARLKQFRGD